MGITMARIVANSGVHNNVPPKRQMSGVELAMLSLECGSGQGGISRKHKELLEDRKTLACHAAERKSRRQPDAQKP